MLWIVAIVVAWLGAGILLVSLAVAAARGDRPTPDHVVRPRVVRRPPA